MGILRVLGLARASEVETLRQSLADSDGRVVAAQAQASEALRALRDVARDLGYARDRIAAMDPRGATHED